MENSSSHPSGNTSASSGNSASVGPVQNTLRMLNKSSHKISKQHLPTSSTNRNPPETTPNPSPAPPQPPVYTINKNDFRDVVQKLTGSPAHLNATTTDPTASSRSPPPANRASATGAATSRLHKIRPPPLSQLGPRPSMTTPNSPLPALPTVSATAESPITAYMRCLHSGGLGVLQQHQSLAIPTPPVSMAIPTPPGSMGVPLFPLPTSPMGFGCIPSPRSGPTLPLPSPKWKEQ